LSTRGTEALCARLLDRHLRRPITGCARMPSSGVTDSALMPGSDRLSREHRPERLQVPRLEALVLHRQRRARSHCWRTWPSNAAPESDLHPSSETWSNKPGVMRGGENRSRFRFSWEGESYYC